MLAEKGFAVSEAEASSLNRYRDDFIKYNSEIPAFVKSSPWKGGDTLVQTQLASTLKRIRDKGAAGFYEGETAQYIVSEMKQGNGIISLDDLKNYEVKFRQPVSFDYKGFNVLSMPMPSSGGLLLKQMMKMVEHRNLEASGFGTVATIHLMTEVERRAFADRAKFMGDRDYVRVPITTLGSDIYLQNRMKDFDPDLAGKSVDIQPGNIATESDETTHLSVIDEHGNAVSVTTTLNGGYGSRTVVSGAGFLLNNEMDDFSVKPGVANMYGAVGDEANAIAPGKRMLSSMTPAIVLKNNEPWIITGTPGGTTIPTSVFQTLIDLIDFNMTPEEAIMKPKFHHQWLPDQIIMEPGFDSEIVSKLEAMGHTITTVRAIGRVEVIMQKEKNKIVAAADVRGEDAAAGY
jgi:gamma-glutamyltranspeptidase/glutathione hydrolase